MRLVSYIAFAAGLALAALWILQELGTIAWLDSPESGAMGMILLGLTLHLLDRQRRERIGRADPSA